MDPTTPFTVGPSSLATVAAFGVSASALVVHAAHSILGHLRLPFNEEPLRKFDSFSNTFPSHSLPCLSPKLLNDTTPAHKTTSSAIAPIFTTQSYFIPSPTGVVELWTSLETARSLATSPHDNPIPSRAHPRRKENWGSCLLLRPIRNDTALSEYCPARAPPGELRPELAPPSLNLDIGASGSVAWSVGCLGFVIGLVCGILVGILVGRSQVDSAKQDSSVPPKSLAPLPVAWTIHSIDESATSTAVKHYPSVLSTIVDSIDNPGYEGSSESGCGCGAEMDSVTITFQDPVIVTVAISNCNLDSTTASGCLGTVDPANVPLPEDEPEEVPYDAETHGTVGPFVRSTLVPRTRALDVDADFGGDLSAMSNQTGFGGAHRPFNSFMQFNSTLSLCSVIDGLSFDVTPAGLGGRGERAVDTAGDTQSSNLHATPEPSQLKEDVDSVPHGPAERRELELEEEPEDLELDSTGETTSAVPLGNRPVDDHSTTPLEANENDSGSCGPSGDNWEVREAHFDSGVSGSSSDGVIEADSVEHMRGDARTPGPVIENPDCQHVPPIPTGPLDSPALRSADASMHARHSRLEETTKAESREEVPTWSDSSIRTDPLSLTDSDSDDIWLLSDDSSMNSGLGLVNVDSLLEIMERESGRDEWLLGITIDELSNDWTFSHDGVPGIAPSAT